MWTIYERAPKLQLPNWYLGAGCITQSVWNAQSSQPLMTGIEDADLIYCDLSDLSEETERSVEEAARELCRDVPLKLDVKNQARVHLWYRDAFGYDTHPYQSSEEAIDTWPTTATSIGITRSAKGSDTIYAPYGLSDLFGLVVRPNKTLITEAVYLKKVRRWKSAWPKLRIVAWNEEA